MKETKFVPQIGNIGEVTGFKKVDIKPEDKVTSPAGSQITQAEIQKAIEKAKEQQSKL